MYTIAQAGEIELISENPGEIRFRGQYTHFTDILIRTEFRCVTRPRPAQNRAENCIKMRSKVFFRPQIAERDRLALIT